MNIAEAITIRGDVTVTIHHANGHTERKDYHNLVVNGGKTIMAKLLGNDPAYVGEFASKIAFGTGATAPAVGDLTLQTEILRKAATVSYPAFNSVMFTATMLGNEGGTNTYKEIGLVTDATGKLFSRLLIGTIDKTSAIKIQVDWTISFQ